MELIEEMVIQHTKNSQLPSLNWENLEFGRYNSDHMLICDYSGGRWQAASIRPFANLSLSPMALCLHYGHTIFEGMKAFRLQDGRINIFRPQKHISRMARSAERMCMPVIPEEIFLEGLARLLELDGDWVSPREGYSLYIRPFMIATQPRLGVKISEEYRFMIITSPCGTYYERPLTVKVECKFVRAAKGGTGYAKCGGNYGGSLYPARQAKLEGYDQVIWTDSEENRLIEESGTMNIMFVIGGWLVTPPLTDSIIDGVTRDSVLTLARHIGLHIEERPVSVEELSEGLKKGLITEAFGTGTAAALSYISNIGIGGINYDLTAPPEKGLAFRLKKELDNIRTGRSPDLFGWNHIL